MTHKYRAKPIYYDLLKNEQLTRNEVDFYKDNYPSYYRDEIAFFASTFEFNVYQALLSKFSKSWIKLQHPVEIIGKGICYPKGKIWLADFAIVNPSSNFLIAIVEAKGVLTKDFVLTLASLESMQPQLFQKVHLVFSDVIPTQNQVIKRLFRSSHRDKILTLSELQAKSICS